MTMTSATDVTANVPMANERPCILGSYPAMSSDY